jgi:hypothetical protein
MLSIWGSRLYPYVYLGLYRVYINTRKSCSQLLTSLEQVVIILWQSWWGQQICNKSFQQVWYSLQVVNKLMTRRSCWNKFSVTVINLVTSWWFQTCHNNWEQAVRTHPDIGLTTTLLQLDCKSVTTCAFLRVCRSQTLATWKAHIYGMHALSHQHLFIKDSFKISSFFTRRRYGTTVWRSSQCYLSNLVLDVGCV